MVRFLEVCVLFGVLSELCDVLDSGWCRDVAQQQEDREQSEETRRFAAEVGEAERGRLRGHAAKLRYVCGTALAYTARVV